MVAADWTTIRSCMSGEAPLSCDWRCYRRSPPCAQIQGSLYQTESSRVPMAGGLTSVCSVGTFGHWVTTGRARRTEMLFLAEPKGTAAPRVEDLIALPACIDGIQLRICGLQDVTNNTVEFQTRNDKQIHNENVCSSGDGWLSRLSEWPQKN